VTGPEIVWRRIAEVATGILGWSPETFWAATPAEFWTAWDGWRSGHAGCDGVTSVQPLARDDLLALMANFPDRPC
jgi:Phage tail assembly chaperone protein, TAC